MPVVGLNDIFTDPVFIKSIFKKSLLMVYRVVTSYDFTSDGKVGLFQILTTLQLTKYFRSS